jgi:hypothetical protein
MPTADLKGSAEDAAGRPGRPGLYLEADLPKAEGRCLT